MLVSYLALSNLQLLRSFVDLHVVCFRAFGVSGFRFSWVSGFWPSGFRAFDACFSSL